MAAVKALRQRLWSARLSSGGAPSLGFSTTILLG